MKVISGPERLTAHELGVKLWNAEYRGKSVGQWTEQAWSESLFDAPRRMLCDSPAGVLGELGLLVMRTTPYLYIMHLHKLSKQLPEFRPYVTTLATWEGVFQHGSPNLKSPERLAAAGLGAVTPEPVATEPVAAAPGPAAPAPAGVAHLRRVK